MAIKKTGIPPVKPFNLSELHAIRVGAFRPSLDSLSSLDNGIDLSGYAYAGLKKWK